MKAVYIDPNLDFPDNTPAATGVHVDESGRALLFTLRAGEEIDRHNAPSSTLFAYIIKGRGEFAGQNGTSAEFGPGTLLVFETGEEHRVHAVEDLLFLGIMEPVPEEIKT